MAPQRPARPLPAAPGPRPRLAVAEDDPTMRAALGLLFRNEGFDVHLVADGLALIDVLRPMVLHHPASWTPDLLLLDIGLPRIDGLYVLEALRELQWQTPAVLLTGMNSPQIRRRVADIAAADLVHKPADFTALAGLLGRRAREIESAR